MLSKSCGKMINLKLLLIILLVQLLFFFPHTVKAQDQNDADTGKDVSGDHRNGTFIDFGKTYSGKIGRDYLEVDSDNSEDFQDFYLLPPLMDEIALVVNFKLTTTRVTLDIEEIVAVHRFTYIDEIDRPEGGESVISYSTGYLNSNEIESEIEVPIRLPNNLAVGFHNVPWIGSIEYEFRVTYEQKEYTDYQNDAMSNNDAPGRGHIGKIASGLPILFDTIYTGTLGFGYFNEDNTLDEVDAYEFSLENDGYLTIRSDIGSVVGIPGQILLQSIDYGSSQKNHDLLNAEYIDVVSRGTYILIFWGHSADHLSYEFEISLEKAEFPQQNDGGSKIDAFSNLLSERNTNVGAPLNSSVTGTVGNDLYSIYTNDIDNVDVFVLPNLEYGLIRITLSIISSIDYSELNLWFMRPNCCALTLFEIEVNSTNPTGSAEFYVNSTEDLHGSGEYFLYVFFYHLDGDPQEGMNSNIEYQIDVWYSGTLGPVDETISLTPSNVPFVSDDGTLSEEDEWLEISQNFITMLLVILGAFPLIFTFYKYRKQIRKKDLIDEINQLTRDVISNSFGKYASSYFVIGQNYVRKKPVDPTSKFDFPEELQKHKFYLHPIRLAIAKLLREKPVVTTIELRKDLGLNWSELNNNLRAMQRKKLLHLENKFVDGSVKQVVMLENAGIKKYDELMVLMINFINSTPLYSQYIEKSIGKFQMESN